MNDRASHIDRRLDRRIPLGCPAVIRLKTGETIRGECVEIGVGGMTLRAPYVPGEAEVLEVMVAVPGSGSVARPPLVARLAVKRCHALGQGLYEIGGTTVRVVG
ncbi:PilZ domain-containing protein [Azoarcus sp. DN11]|uniref:PilZ domain-containing protein n=1 Tax=Azoarcus sp. DN11 TaxID=356837 RepID=UPI000EB1033D|nr:PilZ domain-containing protein [Azoarcus sp. DN11]AYH45494.1 PilZ domain-containing protein [Azoarcus sp. DN11]